MSRSAHVVSLGLLVLVGDSQKPLGKGAFLSGLASLSRAGRCRAVFNRVSSSSDDEGIASFSLFFSLSSLSLSLSGPLQSSDGSLWRNHGARL